MYFRDSVSCTLLENSVTKTFFNEISCLCPVFVFNVFYRNKAADLLEESSARLRKGTLFLQEE